VIWDDGRGWTACIPRLGCLVEAKTRASAEALARDEIRCEVEAKPVGVLAALKAGPVEDDGLGRECVRAHAAVAGRRRREQRRADASGTTWSSALYVGARPSGLACAPKDFASLASPTCAGQRNHGGKSPALKEEDRLADTSRQGRACLVHALPRPGHRASPSHPTSVTPGVRVFFGRRSRISRPDTPLPSTRRRLRRPFLSHGTGASHWNSARFPSRARGADRGARRRGLSRRSPGPGGRRSSCSSGQIHVAAPTRRRDAHVAG
jgi:hypothetical protein